MMYRELNQTKVKTMTTKLSSELRNTVLVSDSCLLVNLLQ